MAEESKLAVIVAMGANFAIAVGKLGAGLLTGSAALLAEAGHSVADTVNQVFLLIGINLAGTTADDSHPHGYGKEAFFWSFLAAIFIFVAGAAFSFYEGGRTLIQGDDHHRSTNELAIAFGVLGVAGVFEVVSLVLALRALFAGARRRRWGVLRFLRQSPDLTTKTVFWEDSAALIGLALAAAGLALSETTGHEWWDGAASVAIGVVLTGVAFMLGVQARSLLLGAAAHPETRDALRRAIAAFPEIERASRLLTMQLGSHSVLVSGDLQLRAELSLGSAEALLTRLDEAIRAAVPEVSDTFWELHRDAAPAASPPPAATGT